MFEGLNPSKGHSLPVCSYYDAGHQGGGGRTFFNENGKQRK